MQLKRNDKLFLNNSKTSLLVALSEIIRCESKGSYTTFYFSAMDQITVSKTIKEYDYLLSQHGFLRTHQSHLVNGLKIQRFDKGESPRLLMSNGDFVPVSQRRKESVFKVMKGKELLLQDE